MYVCMYVFVYVCSRLHSEGNTRKPQMFKKLKQNNMITAYSYTAPLYPTFFYVPLCPLFLCAYFSSVPTVPLCLLFLCAHFSPVPTVPLGPLFLCAYYSSVPPCPLFLCSYSSSLPAVPVCPLSPFPVPTVPPGQ